MRTSHFVRAMRRAFLLCTLFVLTVGLPIFAQSSPFVEGDVQILFALNGEAVGDNYGWVGADLGDLNGDGIHEFATSAPFGGDNGSAGSAYIYDGKSATLLNQVAGPDGSRLGYALASAGDVTGDGTLDYVIGSFGPAAYVSVYSGSDHTLAYTLTSPSGVLEGFGASVNGVGDVNGDGRNDLVIGAPRANASESLTQTGRIYLLSGVDGAVIWEKLGEFPQGQLGAGVGGVGDLDGDGISDVVGAAPNAGTTAMGEAYVFSGKDGSLLFTLKPQEEATSGGTFGTFFASGAGDVNADGTPDIFIGDYAANRGEVQAVGRVYIYSGKDGSTLYVFEGKAAGDGIGPGRGIGDVNGDGFADLAIAAWQSSEGTEQGGKVFVYSGKDGSVLHEVTGAIAKDALGVDAFGIGDVSGDGETDYVVSAVGRSFNGEDVGHLYVISFAPKSPEVEFVSPFGSCHPIRLP